MFGSRSGTRKKNDISGCWKKSNFGSRLELLALIFITYELQVFIKFGNNSIKAKSRNVKQANIGSTEYSATELIIQIN